MGDRGALMPRLSDAAAASLCPGSYVLVWYEDDSVWRERLLLWMHGLFSEIVTPDNDKYLEDMRRVGSGPSRVVLLPASGEIPNDITEPVYRFKRYPTIAEHEKLLQQSFADARAASGRDVRLFAEVANGLGSRVSATSIVGREGLPRRLVKKDGLGGDARARLRQLLALAPLTRGVRTKRLSTDSH